jgi:hypothetical protein
VSPIISTSAWDRAHRIGLDQLGGLRLRRRRGPRKALRSIIGAMPGCMRQAPKLITWRSPAAFLQRALVALVWQRGQQGGVCSLSTYALDGEDGLVGANTVPRPWR